jgi:hypothetical protein
MCRQVADGQTCPPTVRAPSANPNESILTQLRHGSVLSVGEAEAYNRGGRKCENIRKGFLAIHHGNVPDTFSPLFILRGRAPSDSVPKKIQRGAGTETRRESKASGWLRHRVVPHDR